MKHKAIWFGTGLVILNLAAWLWVANLDRTPTTSATPPTPEAAPESEPTHTGTEPPADTRTPLTIENIVQSSFSDDRFLVLELISNAAPITDSLHRMMVLSTDKGAVESLKVEPNIFNRNRTTIKAHIPRNAEKVTISVAAGVIPHNANLHKPSEQPFQRTFSATPDFLLQSLSTEMPPFGNPTIEVHFSQPVNIALAQTQITSHPPLPLTITPRSWGSGVNITAPFESGQSYTLTFHSALASRAGLLLGNDLLRTVTIPDRRPHIAITVEGRYLAPEGSLAIPLRTVNTSQITTSLSRVMPQNLLFYAMREAGRYDSMWGSSHKSAAELLTTQPTIRTNLINMVRNKEQQTLIRLADYATEPMRGVYLLEIHGNQGGNENRLICVTDLGLSSRIEDHAAMVWVTSLQQGCPQPGVTLELYAENNELLATATSSAEGFARLDFKDKQTTPFMLLARKDNDLTFLPLTWRNEVEKHELANRRHLKDGASEAFIFCDRGIYRHGETLFLQTLLRRADNTPPPPFPVALSIIKPDGKTFRTLPLMPDTLGSATLELQLPEYLPSGRYQAQLRLPGNGALLGSHTFIIESFVPPQIRVKLDNLPSSVTPHQTFNFSIFAEHLFGKPAAGLWGSGNIILSALPFKNKNWQDFKFGNNERKFENETITLPSVQLAANGKGDCEAEITLKTLPPSQLRALVQASVAEPGGRTVNAWQSIIVNPVPYYIGIKGTQRSCPPGTPCQLEIAAVAPNGTRWQEPSQLNVLVEKITWTSSLVENREGLYTWHSERIKTHVANFSHTLAATNTTFAYTPQLDGDYLITFTDPQTRSSSNWELTSNNYDGDYGFHTPATLERIILEPERASYTPNTKARIRVQAPFAGCGWLSIIKGSSRENRMIDLPGGTSIIEVDLNRDHVPSLEVALTMVRPATSKGVWSAHRASGATLLRILPPEELLNITITPAADTWRPQSKLPVKVRVTNSQGQPLSTGGVTLLAVDEAICALTALPLPDPYGFFKEPRQDGFSLFDVYRSLMPITAETISGIISHTGGDEGSHLFRRLNPIKARRFTPLARWVADLPLNQNGEADMEVDLPEFAGELRLTAVSWSPSAVGAGFNSVKVKRQLIVQPDLARFLAPEDNSQLIITMHNESGSPCTADITMELSGPLTTSSNTRQVNLAAGESHSTELPLKAENSIGRGEVRLHVKGAGEDYRETLELSVRPATALYLNNEHHTIEPNQSLAFTPDPNALTGTFDQSFHMSGHPSINLLGALSYIAEYPYGCCEQRVSSVLPLLQLHELAAQLPSNENTLAQEAPHRIRATIENVLCMQRWDGFAPWPFVRQADSGVTAYTAFFLVTAERAGYTLPTDTHNDLVQILQRHILSGYNTDHLRPYACHVLALAGKPDEGWMSRLYEQRDKLDNEQRSHLARALMLSGEPLRGRQLLEEGAPAKGLREAAWQMLAWLSIDPQAPAVMHCIDELGRHCRYDGHWGTTQNNALALLAWSHYMQRVPTQPANFTPHLSWQGGALQIATTNRYNWQVGHDLSQREIQIRNTGPGPLYLTRRTEKVPLINQEPPADKGFSLRRAWLDVSGRELDLSNIQQGDIVVVRLTLNPQGNTLDNIAIDELLPAGLEIEDANVVKSGRLPWIDSEKEEDAWIQYREPRDDRLLLFTTEVKSTVVFHYVTRAVSRGTFIIPPHSAAAMYNPETWSRGTSQRLIIK